MIPLKQDNVCTIFLHSWLNYHEYTLSSLEPFLKKLGHIYVINDPLIVNPIKESYLQYLQCGKLLEDFFDRQIIICRGYNKKLFKIKVDRIERIPIFLYQTTQKNTFLFGPTQSNLTSTNAIPCDLKIIMGFYGISKWPKDLRDFEPECGRTVSVYKVLKGKAYYDIESVNELADIPIGKFKKQFYLIPNPKLVKGRFFCQKYPDQCHYNSPRMDNRDKHEKNCSDDSIISAKQVN